jgi:hypothetical protein
MATRTNKAPDTEQDRKELLRDLKTEHGATWSEQYKPGSYGCHELLDRVLMIAEMTDAHVRSHPACVLDREWYALADKATTALHELYQRIGAKHLTQTSSRAE